MHMVGDSEKATIKNMGSIANGFEDVGENVCTMPVLGIASVAQMRRSSG